jgi:integrase
MIRKHDATGKRFEIYAGTDLKEAMEAARLHQRRRAPDRVQAILNRLETPEELMKDHVAWFEKKTVATYGDKWRREASRMCAQIREHFGNHAVGLITQQSVSAFLEGKTPATAKHLRGLFLQIMEAAVGRGLRTDNPVSRIPKAKVVVERGRLSLEHFQKIRSLAQPWFVRSLDLAFHTLQRRADLSAMTLDQWDGRILKVDQGKLEHVDKGHIDIEAGPHLREVIELCIKAPERFDPKSVAFECKHLLCRDSRRRGKGKNANGQIPAEVLTREFARLRDKVPEMLAMPEPQRPSFHEIRALGAHVMEMEGRPVSEIQKLLGHTSEEMTRMYLARHAGKRVKAQSR